MKEESVEEQRDVPVITAEVEGSVLQDLEQRVIALETALGELRSVEAGASGRKTVQVFAREGSAALDLSCLSLEQRIAVKSEMARAGLL